MFPKEAFVAFLSLLDLDDTDVTSWSAEEIVAEFEGWVSGEIDTVKAPKAEWVALYEKQENNHE